MTNRAMYVQIRARRLQKLAGSGSGSGSSTPKAGPGAVSGSSTPKDAVDGASEPADPTPKAKINVMKTSTPPTPPPAENPFSKLTGGPRPTSGQSISSPAVRSQSATNSLKRHAEADPQATPRPAPRKPPPALNDETIEVYENSKPLLGDVVYLGYHMRAKITSVVACRCQLKLCWFGAGSLFPRASIFWV